MSRTVAVTILFTDLVGSTELLDALGDVAADELRRRHFGMLRQIIAAHGGREVKNLGDGLMVAFSSAAAGVACAAAMQRSAARDNAMRPETVLGLRVGLHCGDAITEGSDFFGIPVVIAKRLCDRASAGCIMVSGAVRELVAGTGPRFSDLGSLSLKGLSDPVPAAELDWVGDGQDGVPVAGVGVAGGALPAEEGVAVPHRDVPFPGPLSAVTSTRLVGRRSELTQLAEQLAACQQGERRLVLLAGEPGIGKTRLAADTARRAFEEGGSALYGRCDEGGVIPFQPFVEALGHYATHVSDAELQRQPEVHLSALAKLLPDLRERFPWLPEPPAADAETERYRLFEAIVDLLASIAHREVVVLVLDDLHWADRATLLVLKHLMRAPSSSPLLVVGTYRDVEVGRTHPLTSVVHDLRRERRPVDRIDLAGLSRDEVEALITAWAGQPPPPNLTAAVWAETEGHPFFVEEVLRHLLETGAIHESKGRLRTSASLQGIGIPESIKSVIESRLARLEEGTQRVLAMGAVVGRDFSASLLEEVSGLTADALLEHLEEASSARLVVETQGSQVGYRFSHALIRETLYGQLSRSRRANLHMRIGAALESLQEGGGGENLPGLAHHFFEAARTTEALDKAIDYAVKAADFASSQLAYEEASEQLQHALQGLAVQGTKLDLQCRLLLSLGDSQWSSGEYGQARDAFSRAAAVAEKLRDPAQLAQAALGMGGRMGLPLEGGIVDTELIGTLESALRLLDSKDSEIRARLMGRLGSALLFSQRDEADVLGRKAIAMARRIGDGALLSRIFSDTWLACLRSGNLDERLERGEEMVALTEGIDSPGPRLEARLWYASALLESGEIEAGQAEVDRAQILVDEMRQSYYTWFHTVFEAGRAMGLGDLAEGERLMWQAVETGQTSENPSAVELFSPQLLYLRTLQGRVAETHGGSKALCEHFHTIPAFRSGLATIYVELGMVDEARRQFERQAVNDFGDIPDDVFWLSTVYLLTDVCAFLGDHPRAEMLYRLLAPLSSRYVVLGAVACPVGTVDRGLGVLATLLERFDDAADHLQRAAEVERSIGAAPALAATRCDQARLIVRRGSVGEHSTAREFLDEAAEIAGTYGLVGIQRKVDAIRAEIDEPLRDHAAGRTRRSLSEVAGAVRFGTRAMVSTRGRAGMARLVGDGSDAELEQRFGSTLALRTLLTAMAKGFQPSMAFGFEGEIQFEIIPTRVGGEQAGLNWWTIQVEGNKAVARHRTAHQPTLTIHAPVAEFVRLIAGSVNPVTEWIEKRLYVEGDVTLGTRLVELFGGEAPFAVPAELR